MERIIYPAYVTPNRSAWLAAQTPDERRAAKVLVHNEVEHRAVAPADFAPVVPVAEVVAEIQTPVLVKRGRKPVVVSEVD
jgi:hypothetical protein